MYIYIYIYIININPNDNNINYITIIDLIDTDNRIIFHRNEIIMI